MAVMSLSREASKDEMGREIDRRGAVIDTLTEERDRLKEIVDGTGLATAAIAAERDRLAKANAELLAGLDAMADEYLDYVEADMGRELRSRDLPAAWHKARALLDKHKATSTEQGGKADD